jgi:exosortase B
MSTTTLSNIRISPAVKIWWPVVLGLLALYVPTYVTLANKFWPTEENGHGPIILAIVLWLTWKNRSFLSDLTREKNPVIGSVLLFFGILFYVLGRSQEIFIVETGSQLPLLLGLLLLTLGASLAKKFWYPLIFLLFLIPLPPFLVEALTGPLKHFVSVFAENILYWVGYPIARNGVVLSIGPYQLLVADACSGLNSMFSLSALGLFYTCIVQRTSWLHNAILMASIIPIAFFANVIRVMLLVLITYYFGDEVGQGFAHKAAGLVLFLVALMSFIMIDGLIDQVRKWQMQRNK